MGEAGVLGGAAEGRHVLRGVHVRRGQTFRYGGEPEPLEAVERTGALGTEEPAVVELGVDEGDVEAPAVEDLGQLQHRRDVPLRRERHAHGVRLVGIGLHGTHLSRYVWLLKCVLVMALFTAELRRWLNRPEGGIYRAS